MAPGPSFAEYVAAEKAKAKRSPKAAPVKEIDWSGKDAVTQAAKKANSPPDLLSTMIDLATRPLYGVTNTIAAFADEVSKPKVDATQKKLADGDFLGAVGDTLATGGNLATAGLRGLFSNDKANKHQFAEIIEKGTDTAGSYNPDYEDTKDNVNPVVKGALGLVGDIALDPLNLIPGAIIAKGIGGVGKLVKGGAAAAGATKVGAAVAKGAKDAVQTAKDSKAAKAAAEAVSEEDDLLRAQAEMMNSVDTPASAPKGADAGVVNDPPVPKFVNPSSMSDIEASILRREERARQEFDLSHPRGATKAETADWLAAAVRDTPDELLAPGITFKRAHDILKDPTTLPETRSSVSKGVTDAHAASRAAETPPAAAVAAPDAAVTVQRPDTTIPLGPSAQAASSDRVAPIMELLGKLKAVPEATGAATPSPSGARSIPTYEQWAPQYIAKAPATATYPNPNFGTNNKLAPRLPVSDLRTNPERLNAISVQRYLKGAYEQWVKQAGDRASKAPAAKALDTPAKVVKATKADPMGTFSKLVEMNASADAVEGVLGNVLFNQLKRTMTPTTFLKKINEIEDILTHIDRLDEIAADAKTTRVFDALMKTLNIDVKGSNAKVFEAKSNVKAYADAQKMLDEARLAAEAARAAGESATTSTLLPDIIAKMDDRASRRAARTPAEERLIKSMPEPLYRNFADPEQFPHMSDGGTARTDDILGVGQGREEGYFNQWAQWAMDIAISKPIFKALALDKKLTGRARALEAKARFFGDRRLMESMLQREGAILTFGTKTDAIPLSQSQAWELLDDVGGVGNSARAMLKFLYNESTLVPTTNLMDAMVLVYRGRPREEIVAALANTQKRNIPAYALDEQGTLLAQYRKAYSIPNALVDPPKGAAPARIYGAMPIFPGKKDVASQIKSWRAKYGIDKNAMELEHYGNGRTKKLTRGEQVKGVYFVYPSAQLVDELADIVMGSKVDLTNLVQRNAEALKTRIGSESLEMTTAVIEKLARLANDPKYLAKALRATAKADESLVKLSLESGATLDAREIARLALQKQVDAEATAAAKALTDAADAAKRAAATDNLPTGKKGAVDPGAADAARVDAQRAHATKGANATMDAVDGQKEELQRALDSNSPEGREALEQRAQETLDPLVDISATTYAQISTLVGRAMQPLAKMFVADYGMKTLHPFQHSFAQASNVRRAKMLGDLNALSKKYSTLFVGGTQTKVMTQAWRSIQSGVRSSDQMVFEAQSDIEKLIGTMFDPGNADSILGNVFFSNPTAVHRLNAAMESVDIPEAFDVGQALAAAKTNGTDWLTEAVNQWKTWDSVSADPLDFVNRMYVAAEQIATDAGVVQSLTRWATKGSQFASKSHKPGWVQLTATGDSRYMDFIDTKLWWDPAIAQEFGIMDKVSRMSRSFDGEIGKFIHGPFDLVQGAWKYAITLPRPGHHVRNMVGDMSMTFVAEGTKFYRVSSRDAFKILGVRKGYDGLDVNRALEALGSHELPSLGEVLSKGKYGDITAQHAVDAMLSNGLFNSYHALEDLADVSSPMINEISKTPFAKALGKVTLRGGKIEHVAASVSEARDHYVRAQHFMQYIHKAQESGKGYGSGIGFGVDHVGRPITSREELFRMAAAQVKKHHPDGSMLTPFETKYMRRVIPFYSWLRGALPAIVEGALLHPGRNMVFPKASYNLAISMGIDPYSMSDPFPQDQLFPGFLTDQALGPQVQLPGGQYIGSNPGIAALDVANMLGPDPVRGIAGSISPFLRIPAELLSGGSWGTGAQIRSAADYLDSTLPGVNYAANLSGYSVTGSLASMVKGDGLTEQAQVAAGNKTGLDKGLSGMNWFTGLNLQNQSRPNYINYAEIEKRNAAAEASKAGG